jgi:sugar phosphate isomerase/epimerase
MKYNSRRHFIKTSAAAAAALSINGLIFDMKTRPLLSFSTLGCPDWSFDKILQFAMDNGYDGIELRGILRELDLTKCPELNSADNIKTTIDKLAAKKLKIVDLGSSCMLHLPEGADREKNLDEGKRFVDLAQKIECANVRVFPNELPKDNTRPAVIERIIKGLRYLGDFAKGSGVNILMESHGDAVNTGELKQIMTAADRKNVGLVWDVVNMWTVTKEPPADVYAQLKSFVKHTHIKDAKMVDGKPQYVFIGKGETPIFQAIDLLYKDEYKGYYSFEWEKLWHPDLPAPEEALADYAREMKKHFA